MKLTTSILAFFAAGNSAESNRCTDVQFGEPGTFPLTSLSSYPGSGNTWVRYLIEEFTGFYTGSIYSDNSLFHGGFKVSDSVKLNRSHIFTRLALGRVFVVRPRLDLWSEILGQQLSR